MAVRGAKPKPATLRILEGNPSRRPIPTDRADTALPPGAPTEPDWPSLFPGAKSETLCRDASEEWNRVVPVLDSIGLLTSIDRGVLLDYCLTWARLLQCERRLSRDGLVLYVERSDQEGGGTHTVLERHPLSTTVKDYRAAIKVFISELGLSPSARVRIVVPGAGKADDGNPFAGTG